MFQLSLITVSILQKLKKIIKTRSKNETFQKGKSM